MSPDEVALLTSDCYCQMKIDGIDVSVVPRMREGDPTDERYFIALLPGTHEVLVEDVSAGRQKVFTDSYMVGHVNVGTYKLVPFRWYSCSFMAESGRTYEWMLDKSQVEKKRLQIKETDEKQRNRLHALMRTMNLPEYPRH